MSKPLFGDDSDASDNELTVKTNKEYAKSYNRFRQKELLKKYKDRGLADSESDSSSDDSDSSLDEENVNNPKFDEEFFKTLASLKSKNPAIYDKNTEFFKSLADEEGEGSGEKTKSSKPLTLNDFERKVILEKGGKYVDDDDSDGNDNEQNERSFSPTYVDEQNDLKKQFREALNDDDSSEEEFGGIFKKRSQTKEEKDKEEEEFTKWLAGKKEDIQSNVKETLAPLKDYWSKPNLTQRERFLRDYILNKGYADTNLNEIPTYDEIVGDAELSEDEEELEKQAEFEQKFNFRFEEPDKEFVKRYPRTIENSIRQKDEKRKLKRQEIKERKEREKKDKMQELEMLKEMKRKEIEEKIQKLKEVTGNEELPFKTDELDDDFDPDAHDRRMQEIFNDDYYGVDEGEEKPECPDIDELKIEDWDNYDPKSDKHGIGDDGEPHCEDDDFIMDCDYDPKESLQKEMIENTLSNKKRRGRKNRFMEVIKAEKPAFDPEDEKTYGEYIDEYYKLDCEDMIGDTPCRFRYVETVPNDFGLTIEEILLAKNKELNQWASLKKAVQIRPEQLEKKEQRLYKMKAQNEELKRKIFKSLYGDGSDDEEETNQTEPAVQTSTNNKKKKQPPAETTVSGAGEAKKPKLDEADKQEASVTEQPGDKVEAPGGDSQTEKKKKKKKKKPKKKAGDEIVSNGNADNAKANVESTAKTSENNKAQNGFKSKINQKNPFKKDSASNSGPKNGPNKFKQNKNFNNRQRGGGNSNDSGVKLSDERLKAYGINPKKFHRNQKYGKNKN